MLFNIFRPFADQFALANLFRYITFRSGAACLTALFIAFLLGPRVIRWLKSVQRDGQPIREDGPERHLIEKKGTPTMGGVLILFALGISTLLCADLRNAYVWAVMFVTFGYGTLGFFDAQVYSIVASLRHHAVTGDAAARDTALTMGRAILQKQRSRGQWPWHYEVATGAIVDPLPTYAVHQDAMAPMALLMLERETGLVATPAVARGLGWLFGDNELNTSLVDADRSVIWRSIRRRNALRSAVYPLKLARLAGAGPALADALSSRPLLAIDREFRPYHLGLCLYAFAELSASGDRKEQPSA